MLEPRSEFNLALEAFGAERGGEFRAQDLQGHGAVMPQIVGQENSGHTTTAEFALDTVAISQAALEPVAKICHSGPVVTVY